MERDTERHSAHREGERPRQRKNTQRADIEQRERLETESQEDRK